MALGTGTAGGAILSPRRIRCHSARDQAATELLPLSLPRQDVPVEQIFIINTHCHKLLFEFLLILQPKKQILQAQGMLQPKKPLCYKLVFLQEHTVPGDSVLLWEFDSGARP